MLRSIVCCLILMTEWSAVQGQNCTMNVIFEGPSPEKVYCSLLSDELTVQKQDSIAPVHGRLTLQSKGRLPVVYNLFSTEFTFRKMILILVDTGTTTVHIHTKDWSRYRVTGSP